jgi:hypothetical protein
LEQGRLFADPFFYTDHKLTPDPVLGQEFEAALPKAIELVGLAPQAANACAGGWGWRADQTKDPGSTVGRRG